MLCIVFSCIYKNLSIYVHKCVFLYISPATETQWPGPEAVHEYAQRQRGGTQQKRANGKAQVQHLLLIHTGWPLL